MRQIILTTALLSTSLSMSAQQFTIKGSLPGLRAGTEVELRTADGHGTTLAKALTTKDGELLLTGTISRPTLAELRIDDKPKAEYKEGEYAQDRGGKFMLETADYTLTAAHLDSMARNYEFGSTPLRRELNTTINGGRAQTEYNAWRQYIHDAELRAWEAGHEVWKMEFGEKGKDNKEPSVNELKPLKAKADSAQQVVDEMNTRFMAQHPDYAISLLLQTERLQKLFAFTDAQYDAMLAQFQDNYDQAGYADLRKTIEKNRTKTRGTAFHDFKVKMADESQAQFATLVKKGKWNFIDFWASWCGPCRAAIPHVKQMQAEMGEGLNIVSISLDKNEKAWQQAMEQEQMTWPQALAVMTDDSTKEAINQFYEIKAIPYLLVVDPEGRVVLTTHTPEEAEGYIKSQK